MEVGDVNFIAHGNPFNTDGEGFAFYYATGPTRLRFRINNDSGAETTVSVNTIDLLNAWHYVVVNADRDGSATFFLDGISVGTGGISGENGGTINSGTGIVFGRHGEASAGYFDGPLDELRVSDISRSADWIATEYNNQSSPGTFYAVGGQEAKVGTLPVAKVGATSAGGTFATWFTTGGTWTHRTKITISHAKVSGSSNLTNFPVLVSRTDTDWKDTGNGGKVGKSDGTDILFTSSDGTTQLDHELEKYTNTTGELIAWVEIPTLDYDDNTVIYMYYGNAAAADQQDITGTWDANYKGVWHLPNGTTLTALDSTSNNNDGTISGITATTGKINGGGEWDNLDVADAIYTADIAHSSAISFSIWSKGVSTGGGSLGRLFEKVSDFQMLNTSTYYQLQAFWGTTNGQWRITSNPIDNVWHYIAATYNFSSTSNDPDIYLDGVLQTETENQTPVGTANNVNDNLIIGNNAIIGSRNFHGLLDEARFSDTPRTADWIATEYNNQSSPGTFYAVGGQEAKVGTLPGAKFK